jgi:glycolate oxidase
MDKKALAARLKEIVGAQHVLTSDMDLELYSYDASLDKARPDVVVLPDTTKEVSTVMALAYQEGVPVIGRGSGTNLTGGTIPVRGGIILHFSRMNRILEVDVGNRTATVEPGVITLDLQTRVLKQGLVYAPDPASQKVSTLGGNFAENSGGPHCLKYGLTSNHMLGAQIVLNDGHVIWTGGKSIDNPGYDLMGLFVGSEGTLGIATKLILKLIPAPEAMKTMLAVFETIENAANSVSEIIAAGIIPATLEMMDQIVMQAVQKTMDVGFPLDAACVLIIELDGLRDGLEEKSLEIMDICRRNRVRDFKIAKDETERNMLWAGRKGAFGAVGRIRPSYMCCDGTVPRTKLPEALARVMAAGKKYDLTIGNVFHAGDGNLHPLIMFDERNSSERQRVHKLGTEILKICVDLGGTISGEHGVGLEKLNETRFIFCDVDLAFERRIKNALDSTDILNPGKMIPPAECGPVDSGM